MKNAIWIVVAVIILIGLYMFVSSSEKPASTVPATDTTEVTNEQPVPGSEDVNEMEATSESEDDDTANVDLDVSADADVSVDAAPAIVKEFAIDGFNFGFSQDEIIVNEGDTVTIVLTSTDGFHDWVVDEFGAATAQIQTGGTASVTFVADKAGTYEYYCSVGRHRENGMVGTLVVQ